jgi:hypothetical protein
MCRAIEAHSLDEILPIRDLAAQLAAAAKIAKNYEAERKCREIRVRAERKAGQLLAEIPRAQGFRSDLSAPCGEVLKNQALADANISTQEGSEWERLGKVPAEEFEKAIITSEAPSARGIVYGYERLHGSEPAVAGRTLTTDDFANAFLEGVIKDITWLENKYSHSEFVKDALANARRTIAARLIPKPPQKGSGIHVVK